MKITTFFIGFLLIIISTCNLSAQMSNGFKIPEFCQTFDLESNTVNYDINALLKNSSIPGNILWPGEKATFTIQFQNKHEKSQKVKGKIDIISYGTKGRPGDIWIPIMYKNADVLSIPFESVIEGNSYININLNPKIPETFGAYAMVADLGNGNRQFITSFVRTFSFENEHIQYPSFCLDALHPDVLRRLGVHAIRLEIEYCPTTDPNYEKWYAQLLQKLKEYNEANIVVLAKIGAGVPEGDYLPLKIIRPWLNDNNITLNTKSDYAWLPSYDDDFKKVVYRLASEFGWPKGPINAFSLWNEPWEGKSISGWQADMIRYREIYTKMAEAVFDARQKDGVDILVGGCSSSANALDKLFPDNTDSFLDKFDFCSIHYQGLSPYSTIKKWVNRKNERGRVKIWDTESWVANTDDRVAAVVATNRAAGYDRAMGVFRENISEEMSSSLKTKDGIEKYEYCNAWSVAASIGAVQHFIGERPFEELLFKKGLPWVNVFGGLQNNPEDGTLVIVGDIGEEFGADNVLFRTARGLNEYKHEQQLQKQINALNPNTDGVRIKELTKKIEHFEVLSGAEMIINNKESLFDLYDFYGNKVESQNSKIVVPLDSRGFFLRGNGQPGSFKKLVDAIKTSRINGFEPLEMITHDLLTPIGNESTKLHLTLTNILNREISGTLKIILGNLTVKGAVSELKFKPFETKELYFDVAGNPTLNNIYKLSLAYEAGNDGIASHTENLHVNQISKMQITVDGELDDWANVLPQPIISEDAAGQSLTEAAWFPFMKFDKAQGTGFSNGYLAYDDKYFYFAAKIADDSPDKGMRRFDGGNEDYCFYPDTVYKRESSTSFSIKYSGKVKPLISGNYTFITNSDDGVRLWINGKKLIDNWENHGPTFDYASIELEGGKTYDLIMDYFQGGGEATIQLLWENSQLTKEIIPTKNLFSANNTSQIGDGLDAMMYSGVNFDKLVVKTVIPFIDLLIEEDAVPDPEYNNLPTTLMIWPKDVRRFSYRMNPELPCGNFSDHDNVQIAFNVLSDDEKDLYPFPPGTMPYFTNYQCSDYEYALNQVSAEFGGGTEMYRLRHPEMPFKHHFPRQPKIDLDGAVAGAQLKIIRDSSTRYVEAAIPWAEIPHVKTKLDKGETIKFSYRVNDNTDRGCMELSRLRSVAKRNGSFQADWREHWANELKFGFEK